MIVYQETVGTFINQCRLGIIADEVEKRIRADHIGAGGDSEFNSWKRSLPTLASILDDKDIDSNIDVAIEYKLVTSQARVDFIVYGKDANDKDTLISIELKQWSSAKQSNLPCYVLANIAGDIIKDHWHPSYQAYNYKNILKAFNEYIYENNVQLESCAYCHNMPQVYSFLMENDKLYPLIKSSPVFLKGDEIKLKDFIKKYVSKPHKELLYMIDDSKVRPSEEFSKMFLDAIAGNQMFSYDDEQSYSISKVIGEVNEAIKYGIRRTIIIKGGPGTGKSVVAINILGQLLHPEDGSKSKNACYVTANYTPREVFSENLIQGDYKKKAIDVLFKKMSSFVKSCEFDYDCIIVDEAHRAFKWKFGYGVKKDQDMIDRLFYASRVNVFFIDENQTVSKHDFLTEDIIKQYAAKYHSTVIEGERLHLTSQFRCLGGENYIAFINSFLGYDNNDTRLIKSQYDFKVFTNPTEMQQAIYEKGKNNKNSRIVAGYTHEWISRGHPDNEIDDYDIVLDNGFKMKWNKLQDKSYLNDDSQFDRVGCVHTIQGVDLDYCGVIIGKDLIYRDGKIVFDKTKNAHSDTDSGIRTADQKEAEIRIRNSYKVLLTRGIKGTYVYCEDKALGEYLLSLINR